MLHKKEPGTKFWTVVISPSLLPAVDLSAVANPRMSPAPGRQERESGKRSRSTGSETGSSSGRERSRSVRSRLGSQDEAEHGTDGGQGQVEVVEAIALSDPGSFIHEESYCPRTPAPVKSRENIFSQPQQASPIFKKVQSSAPRMNPLLL